MIQWTSYLKGQVGAWAPRQPQWQHWGALCESDGLVVLDECIATGTEAADVVWHDASMAARCDEECMMFVEVVLEVLESCGWLCSC